MKINLSLNQLLHQIRGLFLKAGQIYSRVLVAGLCSAYAGAALAAFDETRGPFMDVMCPVVGWLAALVVPVATIAFIVAGITFLWGEEMMGMTKKWIYGILAVCIAFSGGAIASWAARKFGYMSACY